MKILTVIQRFYPVIGGSENLTKNLMDYMTKKHKITVYTTSADDIQSFWYAESKKIRTTPNLDYEVKQYDFLIPTEIKHNSDLNKLPIISNHPGPFSPKLWNDLVIKKIDFRRIRASIACTRGREFPTQTTAKGKVGVLSRPCEITIVRCDPTTKYTR